MNVFDDWSERAERLVRTLVDKGKVSSPEWQAAVRAVPRHVFVPVFHERRGGAWEVVDQTQDRWLELVYSNTALVTLLGEAVPISSSSEPGLMTRMLEALDVRDGDRVLEIGTGTGYNAALLAHRLGDANVFSVEVEPELVSAARRRLAGLGYHPVLAEHNGAGGLPEHAPYDRIIATCAVPMIPWEWVEQTGDGGLIIADVKPHVFAGNLVVLRRKGKRAQGRFAPGWVDFMDLRRPGTAEPHRHPQRDLAQARRRTTGLLTERPWEESTLWFLAHFRFPPGVRFGYAMDPGTGGPGAVFLSTSDGSWCEVSTTVDNGVRQVREGGPVSLWRIIEETTDLWHQLGKPGWERFGLTVEEGAQWAWLDTPDGALRWVIGARR
ncbi:methyltransferase domain-containing protein [Allokutzneria sp. A3M-2-11 16]|uniref:methyltransferase domain-containing protein n=1 Tax=Allokutzneria sp. A3M-2-11 16 TaxID=2962043 RepID=UPI0020B8479A|nr:methyltransferase domain-containing protein [Allokutzneria sp. A3M-2-11 16]MCP3802283.1 methyltransferase domain-containing protein [Allokutzneria sp. A3M-2-11 16]